MALVSTEGSLSLDERIRQMDDRCEAIILERIGESQSVDYDLDRLDEVSPIPVALGKLTAVAVELGLIGEEIAAISNGAYYTEINPKTGAAKRRFAFGIVGILSGFRDLSRGEFAYVFDLPAVKLDTPLASGLITPKGFSIVAMGGLRSAARLNDRFGRN